MSGRLEVEAQIAFGLERLSSLNGHHDFEHLCRRLARQRICSNILPATGPVAAGGDQGRDFETFRTYLRELPRVSVFAGLASAGPVAFCCTLQRANIPSKIKSDIESIVAGGVVDSIHFFATGTVDVAKRHELQAWARKQHGVHLEIYDREAIAEMLADPDVFWIASEFLKIPASIYPQNLDEDDYFRLKQTWAQQELRPLNYAGFAQLKEVARDLLHDESRRPDVALWLDCFQAFRDHPEEELAYMAIYEIAVLRLRVKGAMDGHEPEIRDFFEHTLRSVESDRLTDLACLIMYCIGAVHQSAASLTLEELAEVRGRLVQRIEQLSTDPVDPNTKCGLLYLNGFVALIPNPVGREYPDVNVAVEYWLQMVELAPQAPLYELSVFSSRLTGLIEILVEAERYDELVLKTDELLVERTGRYAAAEARVQRAQKLLKSGRLILGMRELNRAKLDWFSKETIGMAAAAILELSTHYSSLGLAYAAKYYALAAAWVVLQAGDDEARRLVRPALIRAAECDYEAGAWLQALDLFSVAQRAQAAFALEPFRDDDPDLRRLLLYGSYILGVSKGPPDAIQDAVTKKISDWPDLEFLEENSLKAREVFIQIAANPDGDTSRVLAMPPFIDASPVRRFEWSALGVKWAVSWPNNAEMTLVAEQFMAVLQLLLADLASADLYILPARVDVVLRLDGGTERLRLARQPSNEASVWEMAVPVDLASLDRKQRHVHDLACGIFLIQEVSLRSEEWPVFAQLASDGPFANTMVGEQYTTIYRRLCDLEPVVLSAEHHDADLQQLFLRREPHQELAWNSSLIAECKRDEVCEILKNRYKKFEVSTKLTLPRLVRTDASRRILMRLREEGWLDWQILGGIAGLAMNYRVSRDMRRPLSSPDELRMRAEKYLRDEENASWHQVPIEAFTREGLLMQMSVNILSTLRGVGLVCRQKTPNEAAIRQFVRHKMRYFDDDIPHDDILAVN
jgi:hypothetical protein